MNEENITCRYLKLERKKNTKKRKDNIMQSISVYDIEANKIEKLCDRYDLTEPELIEKLIEIIESDEVNLEDWI